MVDALEINGYTDQFIKSCQSATVLQTSLKPTEVLSLCHTFKELQKKIARTLNPFNVRVAHKPVMTVGSILKKTLRKIE